MNLLFTDPIFFGHYEAGNVLFVIFYGIFCIILVSSYFLRAILPFNYIWFCVKWILIGLLIMLGINFIKKEIKEWWEK